MLSINNLHASVDDKKILNGLNLDVKSGEVHAIMGPNGAGKTTALRILATILKPDSGSATVAGSPLEQVQEVRRKIGYMPDFYDKFLSGMET